MFINNQINRNTILKVPNPILKMKSKDVTFPLSQTQKKLIEDMRTYLVESNIEEVAKIKNLEPAVGLAAPQIGKSINICLIYIEDENGDPYYDLQLINPKIISSTDEKIYLENGEGCLSIPKKIDGYVHRYREIKVKYYTLNGEEKTFTAEGFLSIAIQHEIDHLNGILYTDYLDPKNLFKLEKNSLPI